MNGVDNSKVIDAIMKSICGSTTYIIVAIKLLREYIILLISNCNALTLPLMGLGIISIDTLENEIHNIPLNITHNE